MTEGELRAAESNQPEVVPVSAWSEVCVGEVSLKSNCADFETLVTNLKGLLGDNNVKEYLKEIEKKSLKKNISYVD